MSALKPQENQVNNLSKEGRERFLEKVAPTASGCWEWQGRRNSQGYGQLHFNRRGQGAHRVFWQLYNGDIPGKLCVCHKCDNPPCVNPDHLFLGTIADNNHDKKLKGRAFSPAGDDSWSRKNPDKIARGENAGPSKLSEIQVKEIIKRSIAGEKYRDIAKDYEIGEGTISAIMQGKSWGHIKRPKFLRRIVKKND